jgi:6-phosphogluconolactonase
VKAIEKNLLAVALSGGSTPKPFYELLGSATFAGRVRWSSIQFFQVDERCVPPDDPQSNYRLIRHALLDSVPLPPANFHRMEAERPDRNLAAREYADQIARLLGPAPGGFPRFDLIFLGLGTNGHTASLFPNSPALEERQAWVVPAFVPELNTFRLTLTFPVLNAAASVIFLVSGEDKAETVRDVLEGPAGRFPAQFVRPVNGRLEWWLERGAARLLKKQ